MAEGKATTIRFAEKIYGRLEKASEETGLPINSIVVVAVLDWLESHPPELVGRGTRGFELTQPAIGPLERHFARRVERRTLPWPGSPRAFDQFSRTAQSALRTAHGLAESGGAQYIGTAHLLAALRDHGLSKRVLMRLDMTEIEIRALFGPVDPELAAHPTTLLLPSTRVKTVLQLAMAEADKDGLQYVGTEHLLLGLVLEGESSAARLLAEKGVTEARIREEIEKLRSEEEA
jgi:hypothetical protein